MWLVHFKIAKTLTDSAPVDVLSCMLEVLPSLAATVPKHVLHKEQSSSYQLLTSIFLQ